MEYPCDRKFRKQIEAKLPRLVRRAEPRRIVPLADTTIYDMECKGQFPRRFSLTPRWAAWDLDEVEAWLRARRKASVEGLIKKPASAGRSPTAEPVGEIALAEPFLSRVLSASR